jgi:predicted Zn-dependent protease with MMP-like domain
LAGFAIDLKAMRQQDRDEFDQFLEEILGELPAYVQTELEQVPVIVEDEPDGKIREEMEDGEDPAPSDLCGLHSGIPLTEKSVTHLIPASPLIMLFRGPILRLSGNDPLELRRQIRITLLHEIGHHFGFSEEDLEDLGYG